MNPFARMVVERIPPSDRLLIATGERSATEYLDVVWGRFHDSSWAFDREAVWQLVDRYMKRCGMNFRGLFEMYGDPEDPNELQDILSAAAIEQACYEDRKED